MDSPDDVSKLPEYLATMEKLAKLKRNSTTGSGYWMARDICPVLGYQWEGFQAAIERAKDACAGVGATHSNHIRQTSIMVKIGSGAQRPIIDFYLSRTGCWLIAMNGDPAKPEIAAAQAYFTIQTRRMELRDEADAQLAYDERRLELRDRVTQGRVPGSGVGGR